MMEAGAAVGLAAAIIEIVRCTKAICDRFEEIHSKAKDAPEAFRELEIQLPLIILILKNVKGLSDKGLLSQDALRPVEAVSEACIKEVRTIETILDKVAPSIELSTGERVRKVIKSLRVEGKFMKSRITLDSHLTKLQWYQTTVIATKQLFAGLDEENRTVQVSRYLMLRSFQDQS